jgi:S-phase kinase-associated protein 1
LSNALLFGFLQNVQQEWYVTFTEEMDKEMLFETLRAANYLNIRPLLDLACLKITFMLQGKNPEEVGVVHAIVSFSFSVWVL